MASLPLSLRAYRCATKVLAPVVPLALERRARRGKESRARLSERLGYASQARPDGTLIWIHGASVGECLSILPLIDLLLAEGDRHILLTSGTVTSAELMAKRLPARAIHQFAPVDTPAAVARFLEHWRPAAGLFVDSEIWPNLLVAAFEKNVKLALVNGRISEKSFAGWRNAKHAAARLFSLFDLSLVQDAQSAARLTALGAGHVSVAGNLKEDSPPLPADPEELALVREWIGGRPIFLATNTHEGEEAFLLDIHDRLRGQFPNLLTIVIPRHAERGAEIGRLCIPRKHARRSQSELIDANTEIYVVDTMGELGLFYRLTNFAFIGKSLSAKGGQNPFEAARLGVAVLAGPHTDNFNSAYGAIFSAQGIGRVGSVEELAVLAERLVADPDEAHAAGMRARSAVSASSGALERTRFAIERMLSGHARA